MSKLSTYLAQHYLTPTSTSHPDSDSRPKKRRKKDKHPTSSGLVIADDDDLLLSSTNRNGGDDKDDGVPLIYETSTRSAEFRKKKGSTWNTVASGEGEEETTNSNRGNTDTTQNKAQDNKDEDATADRILADAATAQSQRRQDLEMEDAPAIVDTPAPTKDTQDTNDATPKMSSGVRAGLQTAADTAALVEKEESTRREERRREKQKSRSKNSNSNSNTNAEDETENQTIYRDASGRIINLSTRKLELERAAREKEALKRQEREEAMGEVQRRQKADRQQDLEEAKFLTLGRGEDDEEMNEMLKSRERWDDPMAGYIAEKTENQDRDGAAGVTAGAGSQAQSRRKGDLARVNATTAVPSKTKVYPGPAPPNRYNIPPGHRWDGVDRGNGFEKDWFQARSRSKRNNELSYQWQMDE